MVLDLRLSKDWDVEMTSFLFFTLFPTLFWTALRAFGTASGLLKLPSAWPYLERPLANGTPSGPLERAKRLERPQGSLAVLVLFVGRRYYLRPIILWNALRPWNAAGFLRLHVHVCAMETQKITSIKNTKFCKYEVETIAGTRWLQNQLPHTCFFYRAS